MFFLHIFLLVTLFNCSAAQKDEAETEVHTEFTLKRVNGREGITIKPELYSSDTKFLICGNARILNVIVPHGANEKVKVSMVPYGTDLTLKSPLSNPRIYLHNYSGGDKMLYSGSTESRTDQETTITKHELETNVFPLPMSVKLKIEADCSFQSDSQFTAYQQIRSQTMR